MRYITMLLLTFISLILKGADVPIIFVHGHKSEAVPIDSVYEHRQWKIIGGWTTWYPMKPDLSLDFPTAMTKIADSHYGGYSYGLKADGSAALECNIYAHQSQTLSLYTENKKIQVMSIFMEGGLQSEKFKTEKIPKESNRIYVNLSTGALLKESGDLRMQYELGVICKKQKLIYGISLLYYPEMAPRIHPISLEEHLKVWEWNVILGLKFSKFTLGVGVTIGDGRYTVNYNGEIRNINFPLTFGPMIKVYYLIPLKRILGLNFGISARHYVLEKENYNFKVEGVSGNIGISFNLNQI